MVITERVRDVCNRCGCDECAASSKLDSLRHSRSRINAYRALSSPSLIALSSKDPVLTAFELSNELRRLATIESEFTVDYLVRGNKISSFFFMKCLTLELGFQEMQKQCQTFATALLDHVRSSYELEVMLNYSTDAKEIWEPGDRQGLSKLLGNIT